MSRLLNQSAFPALSENLGEEKLRSLQKRILRIQQGIWHRKQRAIIVLEGFDAAGKGGAIRRLTEYLDPRGFAVHPIGPPDPREQAKHYLFRFWQKIPAPGTIAIFDRSWYGRVLVERVEDLTPRLRWREAYNEIREFERALVDDGVGIVKCFFAIHPEEQLQRFQKRLEDPYKQWKLTDADLTAHARWSDYVKAVDKMVARTSTRSAPWHLIPADSKPFARVRFLEIIARQFGHHGDWIEKQVRQRETRELKKELKQAMKKLRQLPGARRGKNNGT